MNTEAKKAISDRFRIACEREGLNYSEAARLLGLKNSVYGPHISNEKSFNKASIEAWETVKAWTNSGETIRRYSAKHGNSERPEKEKVPERPDQKPDDPIDLSSKIIPEDDPLPESSIPDAMTSQILHQKLPYCCPVCNGNGLVSNGFYAQVSRHWSSSDATPEKCRACKGTGIIWG